MKHNYRSIIIRMPNWLGDAVMATPVIEDVKKFWADSKITIVGKPAVASLLVGNPYLDDMITLKNETKKITLQSLRQNPHDLGILLTNSFSSAFLFWRGKVRERIGFCKDIRRLFLTKPVHVPKEKGQEHLVKTYKRLLLPLIGEISDTSPTLYLTQKERSHAQKLLLELGISESKIIVGINPGAAYGSAKCWIPDRFKKVTSKLLENPHVSVIYFGDTVGVNLVHSICEEFSSKRVVNLAGKTTLRELIALIEKCQVFLTNDSGPMHIAAALKTPLVALFGSTNDTATGPFNHGHVIHKHVECSPCYKRICPIDFKCMKRIEVEEVYLAIQKELRIYNGSIVSI